MLNLPGKIKPKDFTTGRMKTLIIGFYDTGGENLIKTIIAVLNERMF